MLPVLCHFLMWALAPHGIWCLLSTWWNSPPPHPSWSSPWKILALFFMSVCAGRNACQPSAPRAFVIFAIFLLVAWDPRLEAPGPFQCPVMVRVQWFPADTSGAAGGAAVCIWLPMQFQCVDTAQEAGRVEMTQGSCTDCALKPTPPTAVTVLSPWRLRPRAWRWPRLCVTSPTIGWHDKATHLSGLSPWLLPCAYIWGPGWCNLSEACALIASKPPVLLCTTRSLTCLGLRLIFPPVDTLQIYSEVSLPAWVNPSVLQLSVKLEWDSGHPCTGPHCV